MRSLPAVGHPIRLKSLAKAFLRNADKGVFLRKLSSDFRFLLLCSGTAALTLSLKGLRHSSDKREVITPAYTCPSIVASIIKAGFEPVLCDLKPCSFQMDFDLLASQIGPKTLAVIAVHLFGMPENIGKIRDLTKKKGIFLLEDAAQGFENKITVDDSFPAVQGTSSIRKKRLGSFGDLSILSFGRGKPLSLLSGGALIVNNSQLYEPVENAYRSLPEKPRKQFLPRYFISLFGYSLFYHPRLFWIPQSLPWLKIGETFFTLDFDVTRIDPRVLKLGNILLKEFYNARKIRLGLMELYKKKLERFRGEFSFFPDHQDEDVALIRFPVVFKNKDKRDNILKDLQGNGLGATGSYPVPLNELEGTPQYLNTNEFYPNAKSLSERILTLPLHEYVTLQDVEHIAKIMGKY